jgi:drug/metabolite transporter (DMT)-like permease
MLGNVAEALLTLGMVLIGPALLALAVLLLRFLAKSRRERQSERGEHVFVGQAPAIVDVVFNMVIGAAGAFIALEAYYVGIAVAAAAGVLLFRRARRHQWFALGGYLLGMGLCGAGFLSAALTNHDPAVTYDPSTIPTFWVGVFLALCGAVILAAATTAHPRRGHA